MNRAAPTERTARSLRYQLGGLAGVLAVLSLAGYVWTQIPYPAILFFTVMAGSVGAGYIVARHPLDTPFRTASIRRTATRVLHREQEPASQRPVAEFKQYRWRSGGQ